MPDNIFLPVIVMWLVAFSACGDLELEPQTNPYDPEHPARRKVFSVVQLTGGNAAKDDPSWAPDGRMAAYAAGGFIYVIDTHHPSRVEKLPPMPIKAQSTDVPPFPIDLEYQADLDNGNIPEHLQQELEDKGGLPLNAPLKLEKEGEVWFIINQVDQSQTYTVKKETNQLTVHANHRFEISPKWSPRTMQIAYIHAPHKNISVRDYPGTRSQQITDDGSYVESSLVWSRDGKQLACLQAVAQETCQGTIQKKQIKIMDADGLNPYPLDVPSVELISEMCDWSPGDYWSPGGRLIIISDLRAYAVDVPSGKAQLLPTDAETLCWYAVWSTNEDKILYVTRNFGRRELWMMDSDPKGTQKVAILTNDIDPNVEFIDTINWSRDESGVLFEGADNIFGRNRQIFLMRMESGASKQ